MISSWHSTEHLDADQKSISRDLLRDLTDALTYDRLTFICSNGQVTAHRHLVLLRAPQIAPRIANGSSVDISWAPREDVEEALNYLQFATPLTRVSDHSRTIARWFMQPALCRHVVRMQLAGLDPGLDTALTTWQPDQAFFQGGPPTFSATVDMYALSHTLRISFDRIPGDQDHLMANLMSSSGNLFRVRHRIPGDIKLAAELRSRGKLN